MVNQLNKFTDHLSDETRPLRELLLKDRAWVSGEAQRQSFKQIKDTLTKFPVLALFDPNLETIISADASSYGLGAVLLQKQPDGALKPVAFISRALTPTESRYAQIEKEALAFTWACERLSDYLIGLRFHIHTDPGPPLQQQIPGRATHSSPTLPTPHDALRLHHFTCAGREANHR